jgi:hypothetical protein
VLKRIFISLLLGVSCALVLAACGGTETANSNTSANTNATKSTTTTTTTTSTPATTSSPATTTPASGEKIGVAECDDFLDKYDACVKDKIPESVRAQYQASIAQWRKSWRDLAANPQTKGTLANVCKTQLDSARQSMKSFGCEF